MRSGRPPSRPRPARCSARRRGSWWRCVRSWRPRTGRGRRRAGWPWADRTIRAMALPDEIRAACARVAAGARFVRVVEEAIPAYAATLPAASPPAPDLAPGAREEERAAFSLQLNAVNFGSGWFPTLRKPPGLSGFRTVEAGLRARGALTAAGLRRVDAAEAAATFRGPDPQHELMGLFAP